MEDAADRTAAPRRVRAASVGQIRGRVPAIAARIGGGTASAFTTTALCLVASAVTHTAASAADWNVTGFASTRIEADTNRDLEGEPEPIYGATARLGLEAAGATDTSFWAFRTGLTARAFGGSGDTEGLNRTDPDFRGEYAYDGKYIDTETNLDVQYEPVSSAQIEDTGITAGDATQFTVRLASYATYAVDPRDRVTAGANLSLVRFTEGQTDLRPTTTIGGSLGWVHDINRTTAWDLTFSARRFTSDGNSPEERLTFDLVPGLSHQFNQRLSVEGGLGVSATESDGYELGLVGTLGVAWQPTADTSFSFAFDHGVEPSSVGALRTTTSLDLGVAHSVNSWTEMGLSVGLARRSGGDGSTIDPAIDEKRNLLQVGSSIDFSLAPAWRLGVGYALTLSSDNEGDAVGNLVFMQVTRDFTIIP